MNNMLEKIDGKGQEAKEDSSTTPTKSIGVRVR
jgi:hypothetical protein